MLSNNVGMLTHFWLSFYLSGQSGLLMVIAFIQPAPTLRALTLTSSSSELFTSGLTCCSPLAVSRTTVCSAFSAAATRQQRRVLSVENISRRSSNRSLLLAASIGRLASTPRKRGGGGGRDMSSYNNSNNGSNNSGGNIKSNIIDSINSSSALFARGGRGGGGGGGGRRGRRGQGRGSREPLDYGPAHAGQHRARVHPGASVEVIEKQHQRTGKLTSGTVSRLLTSSGFHPRGIKVLLEGGAVGRVLKIVGVDETSEAPAPELKTAEGGDYDSSSSSTDDDANNHPIDPATVASTTIGTTRRRHAPIVEDRDSTSAPSPAASEPQAPAAAAAPARPVRKFRTERVQGRSWSLEGDNLVARGEEGKIIRGAEKNFDGGDVFGRRRRGRG